MNEQNTETCKYSGMTLTEALQSTIKKEQKASNIRVVYPHSILTMEYNGSRCNIYVDENGVITGVGMG
jgi:hypothetical protein